MVDYRGFGKHWQKDAPHCPEGRLTIDLQHDQIQVPEKFIVLYGRSLGSGFCHKLASANNPGLLMWMPPTTVSTMLPKDTFLLCLLHGPFVFQFLHSSGWNMLNALSTLFMAQKTHSFHLNQSIKLGNVNSDRVRLHPIIGGGHNNLHNFPMYHPGVGWNPSKEYHTSFDIEKSSLNFKEKPENEVEEMACIFWEYFNVCFSPAASFWCLWSFYFREKNCRSIIDIIFYFLFQEFIFQANDGGSINAILR